MKIKSIKSERVIQRLEGIGVLMKILAFGVLSVMGKEIPLEKGKV